MKGGVGMGQNKARVRTTVSASHSTRPSYVLPPTPHPSHEPAKRLGARQNKCVEHGTLEDRGEARARGCKSGREGWSLATVYVWSTARGRRARAGARVGGRGGLGGTLWARRWVVVGSPPSMEHAGRSSAHRGEGRRGGRTRSRSSTMHTAARRIRRRTLGVVGAEVGVVGAEARVLSPVVGVHGAAPRKR